ncbi:MAG: cytochrome c maturation protein CcmE [Rhodospirillales bacterium]|jgi:cytochrome c-type biogenesis protein CcmE
MKRKHKRLSFVALGLLMIGSAVVLVSTALEDNITFFYSPTEILAKEVDLGPGRRLRIGGLVEDGSITKADGSTVTTFRVTDLETTILVSYQGILPDIFDEGQGVVAEGYWRNGAFIATEVLAKHDENYMPPEVAAALKKSDPPQQMNTAAGNTEEKPKP